MKRQVIIDLDAGTDDAYALLMLLHAHKLGKIKLEAITCVRGNTTVNHVIVNVLRLLETVNMMEIPIFKGATEPLVMPAEFAEPFHGADGFGDLKYDSTPDISLIQNENAVSALNRIVSQYPNAISLICVGPLTNIALALKMYEGFGDKVGDMNIMGGNYTGVGNATAAAEFNFHTDPEAANIVLNCLKCPITIMPLETCRGGSVPLTWRCEILGVINNKITKLMNRAEEIIWNKKRNAWYPCDAYMTAAFLYPQEIIVRKSIHNANIELAGNFTRGQVVLDHTKSKIPNVVIVEDIDKEEFKKIVLEFMKGF